MKTTFKGRGKGALGLETLLAALVGILLLHCPASLAQSIPTQLGDLNSDGALDVRDLVLLINHLNNSQLSTLSPQLLPYADVNEDGYVNQDDLTMLRDAILGTPIPVNTRPVALEPATGSSEVGVTVRPKAIFQKPIDITTLNSNNFYATFAGRRLAATITPAHNGTFAWLFFHEPMPNASQVQVTVDGSTLRTRTGLPLDADGDGTFGGVMRFNFSTVSITPIPNTALAGRIVDPGPDLKPRTADDFVLGPDGPLSTQPIEGVKVFLIGMEDHAVFTDSNGVFRLEPVPVGDVKLVTDGRTATTAHAGFYWPEMVMDAQAEPGITNFWMLQRDSHGTIFRDENGIPIPEKTMYLPRVASNVLQTVSAGVTNLITLQSNAAYTLSPTQQQYLTVEIMPGSLIGMDGQPLATGQVGVSVVPPELVRDMLPPGLLQHTFDITVQAPGISTFATPAPMTFPNIFNAPSGTKLNFLSFDHTTGRLVIEGTATVSEDGLFVRTDPGTGITHPGWHGLAPPGWPWTPPPPPPITGCRQFDVCAAKCYLEYLRCLSGLPQSFSDVAKKYFCSERFLNNFDPTTRAILHRICDAFDLYDELKCHWEFASCLATCRPCPPRQPAKAPKPLPSTYFQLRINFDRIRTLTPRILPGFAPSPIPPGVDNGLNFQASQATFVNDEVLAEVTNLFAQAESTVGGDVVGFLQNIAVETEESLAPLGELDGNAPEYPVAYVATILGPNGEFKVRGRTEGHGQYSVFVGSDSKITDVVFYDSVQRSCGRIFPNRNPMAQYRLPRFYLAPLDASFSDSDQDGLPDIAEDVFGTDSNNPDTDGDGVRDGAEIQQGLDPLSGRAAATGVIASLPLPGTAKEVVLEGSGNQQQTAYVALGSRGLGIVNASQFRMPILLGQLDLPGDATDVTVDSTLRIAVVAANGGGLHFVNVADPMNLALLQTLAVNASQVEVISGIAYVAAGNQISSYELLTRQLLQTLSSGGATITGLVNEGLFLYIMDANRVLRTIDLSDGAMTTRGSLTMPVGGGKLFVGNGIAYVAAFPSHLRGGYATADVSAPDAPIVLSSSDVPFTTVIAGSAFAANGSGLGILVGQSAGGVNALEVMRTSDSSNTYDFVTRFVLPAEPFSIAIGAGIGFVAGGSSGLQVLNYLSFDNQGVPPAIRLTNSFVTPTTTNGLAEEGKLARVSAICTDDVQVRDVEFHIDGVKVFTDVSFPFEHRFVMPTLASGRTSFTVRAKATDTGGNFTWTDEINVSLTPDMTPPRLVQVTPAPDSISTNAAVMAIFNEPMAPSSFNFASFQLLSAGPDFLFGTADDVTVPGVISYRDDINAAVFAYAVALPFGAYRGTVTTNVTDLVGNHLRAEVTWNFVVAPTGTDVDTDADGWPDANERLYGTDPQNPASRPRIPQTIVSAPVTVQNLTMNPPVPTNALLVSLPVTLLNSQTNPPLPTNALIASPIVTYEKH